MTASAHEKPSTATGATSDELALDELLQGAITYEAGSEPEPAEPVFDAALDSAALRAAEPTAPLADEAPVSWMYWSAAVVWNLPGAFVGWLVLRKTHPRTARVLLAVGAVSFAVVAAAMVAALLYWRSISSVHVFIEK